MSDGDNSYDQQYDYGEESQMIEEGSQFDNQDDGESFSREEQSGEEDGQEHDQDNEEQNQDEQQEVSHITYQHSSDFQFSYVIEVEVVQAASQTSSQSQQSQEAQVPQRPQGLSAQTLNQIPIMRWKALNQAMDGPESCIFCLRHYQIGQNLRVLTCLHRFHKKCIDLWFAQNTTCPTCRNSQHVV